MAQGTAEEVPNLEGRPGAGAGVPGFSVGQRVHATGDPRRTATVRYVGLVEGYDGTWVGVDWDDGGGKHDGVVNGVRYFTAKGQGTGSLVRPKNLSAGIALLEALHLRYRGESTKEEEDEMYVFSARNKRVSIQLVGKNKVEEKLTRFEELLSASLSYLGVSSIGPPSEINSTVPNLKELDLTGSLLSNWQDIGSICEALPALNILILTNNLLESGVIKCTLSKSISVLVLNNCRITWEQVETLEHSLRGIEELHLMGNKLKTLMSTCSYAQGFDSLRILNLEDNHIDTWDEVLKLSQLRRLEQLHLNKNRLKHIFYPLYSPREDPQNDHDGNRGSMPFENLRCLLLGCNEVEDLASIDSLNSFPNLMDIRLSENPVADPARGGVPRFVLVARLSKVTMLNGSEVTSRERRESEIRYVRLVMAKLQFDDAEEIKRLHPRFAELKIRHGIEDEKPSTGITGPQKMASGLLSVTLKCVGASMGEKPPMTKRLPPSTTVGKLKVLCESFFKLKVKPRLFLLETGSPLPLLLDDEMAQLVDLGISTDVTILADE
uniref:Tubulin-specific chaperone E n=1 Tax=Anthurium amnicola TaxID=1678845 RepID=A0A1D1YDC0_9ARAE